MTKKIVWKHVLGRGALQRVSLPVGSKVLSAQLQGGEISAWFLADPEAPLQDYSFALLETGEVMDCDAGSFRHVATVLLSHGVRVVHVFVGGGA